MSNAALPLTTSLLPAGRLASGSHPAKASLRAYYHALLKVHGPQRWWPGRSRFEVIVGAILVQNTAWTNVELAIRKLRKARLLNPSRMLSAQCAQVEALIRPAGYFRQKSRTLFAFCEFLLRDFGGSLHRMFRVPTADLRSRLLAIRGIGPETADSILVYAGGRAVFVVGTYARRILERHGLTDPNAKYDQLRLLVESSLPAEPQIFNEFHALLVQTGKHYCHKAKPLCHQCPLQSFLPLAAEIGPTV